MANKNRNAPRTTPRPGIPRPSAPARLNPTLRWLVPLLSACFILLIALNPSSTESGVTGATMVGKVAGAVMTVAAVICCAIRLPLLRRRFTLPVLGVTLWVAINGVSTFYALSGKFALREFLKLLISFCLFLLILCWSKDDGKRTGRVAASMLCGGTAIASLVSIDMISTHWISGPVTGIMSMFSTDFLAIAKTPIEAGVRINSLYENPNIFAGAVGLAVLLGLGLAVSAEDRTARCFHLACLFLNSLAFVLAFSMGASGTIAVAFLVYLVVERRRRGSLLVLMVDTLVLAVVCAFPIFVTSFGAWDGFQIVPLLCAGSGAAALCALDHFGGRKLGDQLEQHSGALIAAVGGVVVLAGVFALAAFNLTGTQRMAAGETLRRAEYPAAGSYTMRIAASGKDAGSDAVAVSVESQNQAETIMHTSTVLYNGPAQGAAFTVPEDSLVVYFNFTASADVTLEEAAFSGGGGETSLKLGYKLLPGFIANRLQGLFANQNAIQRVVFFSDGIRLFQKSPVVGHGMGAFESALRSVQSFDYETKYTHNHYIETLINTGVVGLALFLAALALCVAVLLKNLFGKGETHPLTPALAAALVFLMGHAAVEVILSSHFYLPMAFGVLALICLCCGHELPIPGPERIRTGIMAGVAALMAVFLLFLSVNIHIRNKANNGNYTDFMGLLESGAAWDRFERYDYMLSYISQASTLDREEDPEVYRQARKYADELSTKDSNTIPPYLVEFYFSTGDPELAYAVLDRYVEYLPAASQCWQKTFQLLEDYDDRTDAHREQVEHFYTLFQTWNAENMGTVSLTEANRAYLDRVLDGE